MKKILIPILILSVCVATAQSVSAPGAGIGPGMRYATDAYPGFDTEKDVIAPERKEPRWFQFVTGPKCDNATDQLTYCRQLEQEQSWSKAVREYDAIVRNWPTSAEAPEAQRRMAEILLEKEDDADEAFAAYRYLVDFYSFRCDYTATVDRMYEIAGRMRMEGKTIVFFRFRNTVEVRRAYEACVLRAPGATWAPKALLMVGELREEEGRDTEAVTVYENLRNLHYGTDEAKEGVAREAQARMRLLREHGYNRARCVDTAAFLKLAKTLVATDRISEIEAALVETEQWLEEEAYRAACFYDSRMRTRRSAATAYEKFLKDYPNSPHAADVRTRLDALKGTENK